MTRRKWRERPQLDYDAFISYSSALHGALASSLQHWLERFATPWYRPRSLRILRDYTSLSASYDLWGALEEALSRSSWLILLASPAAARSKWNVSDRKRITDWLPGHIGKVVSAAFSPDGTLLALGGEQGRVLLVDVAGYGRWARHWPRTRHRCPAPGSPCGPVRNLALTRDGKQPASATDAAHEICGITPDGGIGKVIDPSSVRLPGTTL